MAEPKVRFRKDDGSSYPSWNNVVLGDIATRITRKNTNGETDRPLTIASIEGLVDQRTYFNKTIASKDMSGYFLLKNGEFAYNKSYSAGYDYGSIKRLDKYDMGALSTLYICFAINEDQNSDFYDCYFNGLSWYNQMPQICAEGARNHGLLNVSPNDFFKIQLSVPSSKEEQQKIADFLYSIDEVISNGEHEVVNLETQKKAAMKKVFSQDVRFKKKDGSVFPDWEEILLADILSEYKEMCEKDGTYEHVSLTKEGVVPKTERYERDFLVTTEDKKYRVTHLNDICYNPANLKFGVICRNKYKDAIFSPIYVTFTVNEKYAPEFIEMVVTNEAFIQRALKYQQGTVYERMAVSPADLLQMTVGIPCLEEQRLIADFLSDFDEAIAAAKKELELWKKLKKGLLQQMFV
ncbi:MAG: restriction endonuclease subunit S [Oscillospiraceae bacterium]|nr:restriction endonuclease subunit S [Oscillospiraceae bacterium]